MTGKTLLLDAMQRNETPRAPWLPYVGVHGGSLINARARDFLHSAELLVRGQLAAVESYQADGIPVVFDLQMEAEALAARWFGQTMRRHRWPPIH